MLKNKKRDSERVLDVLFAEGAIEESAIAKISDEIKKTGETASEILLRKGKISEQDLSLAISKSSGIPLIDLAKEKISREALSLLDANKAKKNLTVPFYLDDKVLKVAVADLAIVEKNDPRLWQRLRRISGRKIDLYIAYFSDIKFSLKHYGLKKNSQMIKAFKETKNDPKAPKKEEGILGILITQDLIQPEEAKKLKTESERKKIRIDDLLLEKKIVDEDELAKAYSSLYQYPFIRLRGKDILYEVITKFPEEISRKYKVIAFEILGARVVKVAVARPFDPQVDELLKFVADKNELEVDRYITTESDIEEALKIYELPADSSQQTAPSSQQTATSQKQEAGSRKLEADLPTADTDIGRLLKEEIKNIDQLEEIIKQGSVPKIVAAIINFALFRRASDVHIQPGEKNIRVRYRIDGVLNDITNLSLDMDPAIVSRIKILSKLRIDEKRIPQDGRFEVAFAEKSVDIRVSTLPTTHGEKVVLRLLDTSSGLFSLDDLGLRGRAFKSFVNGITRPYGMIIACGPTGSGKSTTLYAALNYINKPGVNIVTLEDPVEYDMDGINQSQAKPDIGYDFADGLRSVLRQDPDIIMVGEIRDKDTAGMAVQSSLTGHLVFSSLHTNDSSGGIPRLINMGIEPFLIISAVNIFIAQRLVRKICPNCKQIAKFPPALVEKLDKQVEALPQDIKSKFKKPYKFYEGKGCRSCNEGYFGRIGIFEVMPMTEKLQKMTMASPTAVTLKQAATEEGMLTMKQDGLIKALEKITTIEEVLRVTIS
ncbi:Flp pilus assembly complex ATPase component TadA [Patescibacteria group bacterium]|nr:Flp pilus assembly complex ATPase component TadA [Patescibacteria group bacterium]